MSGGHFCYEDENLKNNIFGYISNGDKIPNVFEDREISQLVWDTLNLIHDYDWYMSGDTCKDTYLKSKAEFKKKWFGNNRGLRIRKIVDSSIDELRKELYETFNLESDDYEQH